MFPKLSSLYYFGAALAICLYAPSIPIAASEDAGSSLYAHHHEGHPKPEEPTTEVCHHVPGQSHGDVTCPASENTKA